MKQARIILKFSRLSDAAFETKAQTIATAMTGNANFPSPSPPIADLETAAQKYADALAEAASNDSYKIGLKNDARKVLENTLFNLSLSVTQTANGDRTMLVSSGYDVSSASSSPQPLLNTENFKVELGKNSGEAICSLKGVRGAKTYIYQYTASPLTADSKWESLYNSSRKMVITGLDPLKAYCFRVIVTGPRNQTVQTEVITKTIV